jgi:ornithine cyclodeaminase
MIRYLEVNAVCSLIQKIGIEPALIALMDYIAEDFRRWDQFEKEPRTVHHSLNGVNELMPIGDDQLYSFK